ncbi:FAD/NAD(P)-binding protein [Micromonospora sagamiensis]|uniref:FAD-NAD(P)-binding protein n=1 Tax=Micromonospora sagamiensis TaxID=47875 RepID=A0A562WHE2_9ACTN|nr:FAD/NAD(P)-binding protein [Micromonospora sagamiensis]TWJ29605.1 FAD-NAD(P)-binding protein [Micromonospora sagamiensis]BCL17366.1 adenylate cyclase [Micromonospora sagamiensis]
MTPPPREPVTVAVVGAGPRAVGLLERLAANRAELLGTRPLDVHLVDPYPPGPGRIWRTGQSPLLTLNTAAGNVTLFTDGSVTCDGPPHPGPTLAEWARVLATSFPSRDTQGRYLEWCYRQAVDRLGPDARVRSHRTRARALHGDRIGRQRLYLDGRAEPLPADVVVLALGHLDAVPDAEQVVLGDVAARHDLTYLPPGSPAEADLSVLRPGEPVLVRGLGLTFLDLMLLVTEGRGGEFRTDRSGRLRYQATGREPRLLVGSRRGMPHLAKFGYPPAGTPPPLPRFLDAAALAVGTRPLHFRQAVWPLLAKEIGWGYYHRLFTDHPDRTALGLPEFAKRYATLDWYSPQRVALLRRAVPDRRDALDTDRLDRPLRGVRCRTLADLQPYVRHRLGHAARRRADPRHSADLGALAAVVSAWGQVDALASAGRLTAGSVRADVHGWLPGFFSHLAGGPPGYRLDQLRALAAARVVSFLGEDTWVRPDRAGRAFRAGSASLAETVTARALVEARLPTPTPDRLTDPLLRSLYAAGDLVAEVRDCGGEPVPTGRLRVRAADARIIDHTGDPHPCRFALGPYTDAGHAMAFAPPRVNAPTFRQNDAAARAILRHLASRHC